MVQKNPNKIGNWSEEKLMLLAKYLQAYTKIMSKQQDWCSEYHYIDAFAGRGEWVAGDEGDEHQVKGSPIVALDTRPAFTNYVFIERDPQRVTALKLLRQDRPDQADCIEVMPGDCNTVLCNTVVPRFARQRNKKSKKRGVVFLDPYTTNVEWSTIKCISSTSALEIFLNFPIMALNREVLWGNIEGVPAESLARMDRFWGSAEWQKYAYVEVDTLFEGIAQRKVLKASERLIEVFRSRLGELFSYVTTQVVMTNSKNAALYCLMFAGPNKTGRNIAQDVFDLYEQSKTLSAPKHRRKKQVTEQDGFDL